MQETYKIIKFEPKGNSYVAEKEYSFWERVKSGKKFFEKYRFNSKYCKYDDYRDIEIPIGASRVGGPVIDLPENIQYPKNYYFMAQVNLEEFSKHDPNNLLPKFGFLYFFTKNYGETGKVFYYNCKKSDLKRYIHQHESWYFYGRLIGKIEVTKESFEDRHFIDEDGKTEWDYIAGENTSKIYGIFTNCQASEEEIIEQTKNGGVLLLQIGSDFMGEGAHCVYINEKDLKEKNFDNCRFFYNQS